MFKSAVEKRDSVLRVMFMVLAVCAVVMVPDSQLLAMTAPSADSFMYDIYDIGVNKILKGAVGFVLGAAAMGWGGGMLMQAKLVPGIAAFTGGGVMIKADSLVTSLGALIS